RGPFARALRRQPRPLPGSSKRRRPASARRHVVAGPPCDSAPVLPWRWDGHRTRHPCGLCGGFCSCCPARKHESGPLQTPSKGSAVTVCSAPGGAALWVVWPP
ncbi:unnamed protein product, partial [Amoebophrya sp. A120]